MLIDRKKFMTLAIGMIGAGTYAAGCVPPPPAVQPVQNENTYDTTAPADECVDWDPSGECIGWQPAGEYGDGYGYPSDECVDWSPSGECVAWEPAGEYYGPANECVDWSPSGECVDPPY
jgi:hypothetical protein